MRHETTTERIGRKHRWACTCGARGDLVTKRRADNGAYYHWYAHRPMTADEVLTMGDGMYADLTHEEAAERAAKFNRRHAEC